MHNLERLCGGSFDCNLKGVGKMEVGLHYSVPVASGGSPAWAGNGLWSLAVRLEPVATIGCSRVVAGVSTGSGFFYRLDLILLNGGDEMDMGGR